MQLVADVHETADRVPPSAPDGSGTAWAVHGVVLIARPAVAALAALGRPAPRTATATTLNNARLMVLLT
jgi:hypothetical protein